MSKGSFYTVIVSCDRKESNYLELSSAALDRQNIPYDISQGSVSTNNLFGINQSKHNVSFCPSIYEAGYNEKDVRYRAQTNYIHALTMDNSGGKPDAFRMILEDDVVVCQQFFSRLNMYLSPLIEQVGSEKLIMTLYNPFMVNTKSPMLLDMDVNLFWGLQAMIYSQDVRNGFAEYIQSNLCREPHDILIRDYCKLFGIKIYWVSLSLFQHIGETSTGLGNYHKTPNFIDDILKLEV